MDAPEQGGPIQASAAPTPRELEAGEGSVLPNEVYRFLGSYWLFQDQMGWSRIQTLVAIEAAVLAGAFSRQGPLSPIVLLGGTVLIEWIYRLIQRDWQVRDYLGERLEKVTQTYGLDLIPQPTKQVIRGRVFLRRIFWTLALGNLLLAMLRAYATLVPVFTSRRPVSVEWLLS